MDVPTRLETDDVDALRAALALTKAAFAFMDGLIDPPSSVHRLTLDDLATPPTEVWTVGSPPKGSVCMVPREHVLYISKLAVDPAARGQGIATALIDRAERRALELHLAWLELQTRIELIDNHRIFEAMGFAETERTSHLGYERHTSITYRRKVNASGST